MKILFITSFLILFISVASTFIHKNVQKDILHLTKNFFANLQENPRLKYQVLVDSSKIFIDKQIMNYMDLIRQTHGLPEHSIFRRSLPVMDMTKLTKDSIGVYILNGFVPLFNINVKRPKDIVLFEHGEKDNQRWYGAALECLNGTIANSLVIYKFLDFEFFVMLRIPVINGVKLGIHSITGYTYIVVAENNGPTENFQEETGVFTFDPNEELTKIQSVKSDFANDVVLWNEQQEMFMAISQYMSKNEQTILYEVDTPIYKWMGKHFDIVDHIRTYGARKITPFVIGNSNFLAVANFQNNRGESAIYSEIFKYDLHKDQFVTYQKILTQAAVDVKFLSFTQNNIKETFLVFANHFETDPNGTKNYEIDSIIYKYVDDYFIPFQSFLLNGPTEWLPIAGENNEFVLLVSCKFEGIKAFQYNGWKFVESKVQYTNNVFAKGVVSMRFSKFNNKSILVIANENDHGGEMINVFEPTFTHTNNLNKFHNNMLTWCKQSLEGLQALNLNTVQKRIENAPKRDDSVLYLADAIIFNNVTIESLHTVQSNLTDPEENDEELKQLTEESNQHFEDLQQIQQQMESSFFVHETNTFPGDLYIGKLILARNDSYLDSIEVKAINNIEIPPILENVIDINEGFSVENPIEFENITIDDNQFVPETLNGYNFSLLLNQNSDSILHDVIINGDVIFHQGFNVDKLNGINFTKNNILLNKGDQVLTSLHIDTLDTGKMDARTVNDINVSELDLQKEEIVLNSINNVNAINVIIGGFMNNVDMPTLEKYALKTFGDQIITSNFFFESLHVENLNVKDISGKKIPEDLILINNGKYSIEQVEFLRDFNVNSLMITDHLNHINVVKGKLDVLLADVPFPQRVIGYKEFENLELLNAIQLQGNVKGFDINKLNPVRIIDEELILTGDYVISGNVEIQEMLDAVDLKSNSLSVKKLREHGVRITDQVIPVHLRFLQQLNVQEVFADKINDLDVNSLIVTGLEEQQVVAGAKNFLGDVHIVGPTKIEHINGVDLQAFEGQVMRTNGDQTLSGKHHFENIIANRVYNIKTHLGNKPWEDVFTINGDQKIRGTTLIADSIKVKKLVSNMIKCNNVNGYDFTNILNDTVFLPQKQIIEGNKNFFDLSTENLRLPHIDLKFLPKFVDNKINFTFNQDIVLPEDISIENIFFQRMFNEIPSERFGHNWLYNNKEQIIEGDQNFNQLTILGNLFIESGFMNDVNIKDVGENSVKIDETYYFNSVTFANGLVSEGDVTLEGQFESLDLNDIVQSNIRTKQILRHKITFNEDVQVFGEVFFNGRVSGLNLNEFCQFASNSEYAKQQNLEVNGNVYFKMGPQIYYINGQSIRHIIENVWFTNREESITGAMEFEEVVFKQHLTVLGFVDDVKLELIAQTYLSKSLDQNISAFLNFDEGALFANGITAKQATVGGDVNGIRLDEFMRTAILDGENQVFENTIYLEECHILQLDGSYLVNQLDLNNDVMLIDGDNIITGKKIITNVYTVLINLPIEEYTEIRIQETPILRWLQNAVLRYGTFTITGSTTFMNNTIFSKGIRSPLVNGQILSNETTMLKLLDQTITGSKSFTPNFSLGTDTYVDTSQALQLTSLELKGHLNGIDLMRLMQNQAYKNKENVFRSPIHFNSDLSTSNLIVKMLYQGVNISQLITNISDLATGDNYYENYEMLLEVSHNVRDSLKAQAFFLDYYQVRQIYTVVDVIVPVNFESEFTQYLAGILIGAYNYTIQFDMWDGVGEYFHRDTQIDVIKVEKWLHYIKVIEFKSKDHWYVEHRIDATAFEGGIYDITKYGLVQIIPPIPFKIATKTVISVILPHENKDCILVIFEELNAELYCEKQTDGYGYLDNYQTFSTSNSIQAATCLIHGTPYIFIVNAGTMQEQATVDIWKYDSTTKYFNMDQIIYAEGPNSVSVAFFQGTYYLATASGHIQNAKHAGLVDIRKYDAITGQFSTVQEIYLNAPIQVEFALLPTNELVLYVLTDNPTEPLIIYDYGGIAGFKTKMIASTIPKSTNMKSFNTKDNKHFILAHNTNETRVVQAVFKGGKYY